MVFQLDILHYYQLYELKIESIRIIFILFKKFQLHIKFWIRSALVFLDGPNMRHSAIIY